MQVVILAGGAGTRLRPIVSDRPKPMAGFSERPFLEYQLLALRRRGLRDFLLCVGYMHQHIEEYFGDGRRWGVKVQYSVEETPLGTAGALRHAAAHLDERFLLLNGDSFLELDVTAFVAFHQRKRREDPRTLGSLALIHVEEASAYGSVQFDAQQLIWMAPVFGGSTTLSGPILPPNFSTAQPPPLAAGMTEPLPPANPEHRHQLRLLVLR